METEPPNRQGENQNGNETSAQATGKATTSFGQGACPFVVGLILHSTLNDFLSLDVILRLIVSLGHNNFSSYQ
jgi:hypothetical protein